LRPCLLHACMRPDTRQSKSDIRQSEPDTRQSEPDIRQATAPVLYIDLTEDDQASEVAPCPTPYTLHTQLNPTTYTLHPAPYTLHPTPFTLYLTPYTLHPEPCTLYPTLYTYLLHPKPYTLQPTTCTVHSTPCLTRAQLHTCTRLPHFLLMEIIRHKTTPSRLFCASPLGSCLPARSGQLLWNQEGVLFLYFFFFSALSTVVNRS
jgi:hypothetical protein